MKKIFVIIAVCLMVGAGFYLCSKIDVSSTNKDSERVWTWAADSSAWYQAGSEPSNDKIDVLYITSTEVISAFDDEGKEVARATLCKADRDNFEAEMRWVENNMFFDDFNFVAPFYHQLTFNSLHKCSHDSLTSLYKEVQSEIFELFDYYMEHINHNRPFILAGFSQGGMITLDLLRHMTEEQYQRMVATYTIGYKVTEKDLQHPHIKAAKGETDRGVVVSFNSVQSIDAIWDMVSKGAATCINPVNWMTDATPASFIDQRAGISNTVHVDTTHNVLLVESEKPEYYEEQMKKIGFFGEAGVSNKNLHRWDLLFYGKQIHDNALKRARN
ncbi:MAG: DUF3089 domain-containing protein [Bacteroidales bacterium]|nr:DUF3089 domain-containing protein [Bacteroidales bacterium]